MTADPTEQGGTQGFGSRPITETELCEWGRSIGAGSMPPRVVALSGDLGSGKTTLARAILGGFGVTAAVTSPTFALVNRYSTGNGTATHVDLYRLHKLEELDEIGLLEMLQSDAMTIIEWPEIARQLLPEGTLFLRLEHVPGRADVRRVGVTR